MRLHQLGVGHLGDRRLPRHPGVGHLPGVGRPGDPFPVMAQMGCCLGVKLGVGCPCPGLPQMGCCLGEECPEPLERLKLELALQGPQAQAQTELPHFERLALLMLEPQGPGLQPRGLALQELELVLVPLALQQQPWLPA